MRTKHFTVNIHTTNDIFSTNGNEEIARILRETADRIEKGAYPDCGAVYDIDYNRVGHFEFTE